MPATVNSAGYDLRLTAVKQLLEAKGLHASSITTVAYDEVYEYPFNNFLFKVDLSSPTSSSTFLGTQPGTEAAPSGGLTSFILKLCNTEVDMNQANRVQNNVAVQYLVRQSMKKAGMPLLAPAIYAWGLGSLAKEEGHSDCPPWIISEYKPGVDVDTVFSTLQTSEKQQVLKDVAAALAAIQKAELPPTVDKFGGLTFDKRGDMVSCEAALGKGEPTVSYLKRKRHAVMAALSSAEKSPIIQGWKQRGIDQRIKRFLEDGGLETVLSRVNIHQKNLIHADFTLNNMMLDTETKRLTAIVDFDWSYVSNPVDEFISGLTDFGGNIGNERHKFHKSILLGSFDIIPSSAKGDEKSKSEWETAKIWNEAMKTQGCIRPCEIEGVEQVFDLMKFQKLLCPFQLSSERELGEMTEEAKAELRAKTEAGLVEWLKQHGY
ncbi:hypothetical protein NLU13_1097 [Sarocladium strictum]|uniref:non-specific serine/threonine protein kinase n=1 Tax=Sarocladium strictum TaxID=5046 RepID=A0AA39GQB0_SARSR|nr:hypothetical protein NLU13_1097 [Sarocladium strictum]